MMQWANKKWSRFEVALSVEKSGSIRLVSHVYELYVQNFAASYQ